MNSYMEVPKATEYLRRRPKFLTGLDTLFSFSLFVHLSHVSWFSPFSYFILSTSSLDCRQTCTTPQISPSFTPSRRRNLRKMIFIHQWQAAWAHLRSLPLVSWGFATGIVDMEHYEKWRYIKYNFNFEHISGDDNCCRLDSWDCRIHIYIYNKNYK